MPRCARSVSFALLCGLGLVWTACAAPAVPEAPTSASVSSSGAPSPRVVPPRDVSVDAGSSTHAYVDAGVDRNGPEAGQGDAASAADFPAFASCAGLVEGQCCAPSPSVSLCMRAIPANHATGNYTARILVVNTTIKGATVGTMLPIVTRTHGSMKLPDPIVERLDVKVTSSEVTLVAAQGCRSAAKARTTVCAAEGHYGLRDTAFLRLDPEE